MYKNYLKRFLDLIFALVIFVILSPLFVIISILIRIDSKGPAIFKQLRTGKNGKNFTVYKFRSMIENNNIYNVEECDKITNIGRFIRRTSIDELPQLINIIKGDMSFIGPRPWIVDYAKYYTKHQKIRLKVLPGMTGLAQCSGRNNLTIKQRIEIDVNYVRNISLKLDLYIFFKTIWIVLKREGFSNSKSEMWEEVKTLSKQKNIPNAKVGEI